uniref:RNA 3'-terminal phosphate cyclase-like protein n=1 Tax=Dermatophagoides pteronyssinus TaxID=6956 RepID=A0A6P6Y180_DERPT|nr:RNA 3'-terminal phosphate cyclase-like protein [Dermatophagoides pteronyssinus]
MHNTRVEVDAGLLEGREEQFVFECPSTRGIAYYVEFLLLLAPFLKFPLRAVLTGLTHCATDAAVASLAQTSLFGKEKAGKSPGFGLELVAETPSSLRFAADFCVAKSQSSS